MPKMLRSMLSICTAALLTFGVAATAFAAIGYGSYTNAMTSPTSGNASTSLTISTPADTSPDDVLLAQVSFEKGNSVTIAHPSGWVPVLRTNRAKDFGQAVYIRVATGNESGSYSWTFSEPVKAAGGILRYTGVDTSQPIVASRGSSGDSNRLSVNGIEAAANSMLVAFFGIKKNTALTVPVGMTGRYLFSNPQDVTILAADELRTAAGDTGSRTSVAESKDKWAAQLVALRPAPTITPVTVTATSGQSKMYGESDPVFTFTSSDPNATFSGALNRVAGESVNGYAIAQGTLAGTGSYTISSFISANFTITPKQASVTPDAVSKTFGDPDPVLTGTLAGFLARDGVTASYSRTPGETVEGSPYIIRAVLSPTLVLANYAIAHNTAAFTIKPSPPVTAAPSVVTGDATGVASGSARLIGSLAALGTAESASVSFQWGTAPGNYVGETPAQQMGATGVFHFDLAGLTPGTSYYFRARATGQGAGYGTEKAFTTPAVPPVGGGGGIVGGGGGVSIPITGAAPSGPGITGLAPYTNSEGLFNIAATAVSDDGKAVLSFEKGALARSGDGGALRFVTLVAAGDPPSISGDRRTFGIAYKLSPEGATFSPSAGLTISYAVDALPGGISSDTLGMTVWDPDFLRWETVESEWDPAASKVTATVQRSGLYALVGRPASAPAPLVIEESPARFTITGLDVSSAPGSIASGEQKTVIVSAMVNNVGGSRGECEVTLRINGTVYESRTVPVLPGASTPVRFAVSQRDPGRYEVDLNGSTASFVIDQVRPTPTPVVDLQTPPSSGRGAIWAALGLGIATLGIIVVLSARTARKPAL